MGQWGLVISFLYNAKYLSHFFSGRLGTLVEKADMPQVSGSGSRTLGG